MKTEPLRYTISILTYTAVEHAKRCIASVLAAGSGFKLVLTANGNPAAAEYFKSVAASYPQTVVIVNDKNEGFIKPTLKAFEHCDTDYFVCLNDDAEVPAGWLDKLRAPFETDPSTAITGPEGGCCGFNSQFQGIPSRNVEYVEFACAMLRADLIRKYGLFDPELEFAYFEDCHQSFRMRELGYRLKLVPFRIKHARAATSKTIPEIRGYQAKNGAFMRRRWGPYIKTRRFDNPIVIKRDAAWGDVLLTTPIVKALKERSPQSPIWIQTKCPTVFDRSPHVTRVAANLPVPQAAQVIDLNGAYENAPGVHVLKAYEAIAGVKSDGLTELFCSESDRQFAERSLPVEKRDLVYENGGFKNGWIAVHVGPTTWRGKNWPFDRWDSLIRRLPGKTVIVGHGDRTLMPATLDLRGKTSLHQLASVIQRCRLMVTVDSLPMHVAQAMGTPVVGLFGITNPQFLLTDGSPSRAVCADPSNPSTGLRHRVSAVTKVEDTHNCMATISVDAVLQAVTSLENETRPVLVSSGS